MSSEMLIDSVRRGTCFFFITSVSNQGRPQTYPPVHVPKVVVNLLPFIEHLPTYPADMSLAVGAGDVVATSRTLNESSAIWAALDVVFFDPLT